MTKTTTKLPKGYHIYNDGREREVLIHDEWDGGKLFKTVKEATDYAIYLEANP